LKVECPVWTTHVVLTYIDAEDTVELEPTEDQQSIEALAPYTAHPALDVRVRVRRLGRCPDDPYPLAVEDGVEGAAELRVTVVDQEPRPPATIIEIHLHVPCLLHHPGAVGVARTSEVLDPTCADADEDEHVQAPQQDGVDEVRKSQASVVAACWRTNERQSSCPRRGAGGTPAALSTFRTSVAETSIPSLRSSPTIRR
jgi:hypothetical protein